MPVAAPDIVILNVFRQNGPILTCSEQTTSPPGSQLCANYFGFVFTDSVFWPPFSQLSLLWPCMCKDTRFESPRTSPGTASDTVNAIFLMPNSPWQICQHETVSCLFATPDKPWSLVLLTAGSPTCSLQRGNVFFSIYGLHLSRPSIQCSDFCRPVRC